VTANPAHIDVARWEGAKPLRFLVVLELLRYQHEQSVDT